MKQEEIREGIKNIAETRWKKGYTWEEIAEEIMAFEHRLGVVIKVCERDVGGDFAGSYTRPETLYEVEPLIKEE